MVTFAVNGLIAWAATFMQRVHGLSVARVGAEVGMWGLAGGETGALFGGRLADRLQQRWRGGRTIPHGTGLLLGASGLGSLVLVEELRLLRPIEPATCF